MSYQVTISGHSAGPHNAAVQAAVEAAVEALAVLPEANVSASGYSRGNGEDKLEISIARPVVGSPEPSTAAPEVSTSA